MYLFLPVWHISPFHSRFWSNIVWMLWNTSWLVVFLRTNFSIEVANWFSSSAKIFAKKSISLLAQFQCLVFAVFLVLVVFQITESTTKFPQDNEFPYSDLCLSMRYIVIPIRDNTNSLLPFFSNTIVIHYSKSCVDAWVLPKFTISMIKTKHDKNPNKFSFLFVIPYYSILFHIPHFIAICLGSSTLNN